MWTIWAFIRIIDPSKNHDWRGHRFVKKKDKSDIEYDIKKLIQSILLWKAHILTTNSQEKAKQKILEELHNETPFWSDWFCHEIVS